MQPWRSLSKPEPVRIIAPDGSERCSIIAYYCGSHFMVEDVAADMEPGDELRRLLPNGKDDVFRIDDPQFYDAGGFGPHYQVAVSRKGTFPHNSGGHIISVSGDNSRVNLQSTDNSTNIVADRSFFGEIETAITDGVADPEQRDQIIKELHQLRDAVDPEAKLSSYQRLIGAAANHMTILAPFLPVLGTWLST